MSLRPQPLITKAFCKPSITALSGSSRIVSAPQICKPFRWQRWKIVTEQQRLLFQANILSGTWALLLLEKRKAHGKAGGGMGLAFSCNVYSSALRAKLQCQLCP